MSHNMGEGNGVPNEGIWGWMGGGGVGGGGILKAKSLLETLRMENVAATFHPFET